MDGFRIQITMKLVSAQTTFTPACRTIRTVALGSDPQSTGVGEAAAPFRRTDVQSLHQLQLFQIPLQGKCPSGIGLQLRCSLGYFIVLNQLLKSLE